MLIFNKDTSTAGTAPWKLPAWQPVYWLYAAAAPLTFYAFLALRVSLYHTARSPNVDMLSQFSMMLVCYGSWVLVPRLTWVFAARLKERSEWRTESLVFRLGLFGLMLASIHLYLITLMRLKLFATATWLWEPIHVFHNYGEVWLSFGVIWLIAYGITTALILSVFSQPASENPPARYHVRENGKTLSIPIDEIFWVKAAGNYVELHTERGILMVRKSLGLIQREFGNKFLKSHRSALINGRHVVAIKNESGGYLVQLSNGDEAPLSRRQLTSFKDLLKTVDQ